MLTAGIYASGEWGVSFRQRDDVLFCWLERGQCQLIREGANPLLLRTGDFILIRTETPFALVSHIGVEPEESETIVERTNDLVIRVGNGDNPSVVGLPTPTWQNICIHCKPW